MVTVFMCNSMSHVTPRVKRRRWLLGPFPRPGQLRSDQNRRANDAAGREVPPAFPVENWRNPHFLSVGADDKFVPTESTIDGDAVVVQANEVATPAEGPLWLAQRSQSQPDQPVLPACFGVADPQLAGGAQESNEYIYVA